MTTKSTNKTKLYISFDVETDGPSTNNNLLSIGFCGLTNDFTEIFSIEYNIKPLPTHEPDSDTMNWWLQKENSIAWNYIQQNQISYIDAFNDLSNKLKDISQSYTIEFIAHPSCFDWMFFKSYYDLARKNNLTMYDIGYKCTCASTTMTLFKQINKMSSNKFNAWLCQKKQELQINIKGTEHTPLYDAKNQGTNYLIILNQIRLVKQLSEFI